MTFPLIGWACIVYLRDQAEPELRTRASEAKDNLAIYIAQANQEGEDAFDLMVIPSAVVSRSWGLFGALVSTSPAVQKLQREIKISHSLHTWIVSAGNGTYYLRAEL